MIIVLSVLFCYISLIFKIGMMCTLLRFLFLFFFSSPLVQICYTYFSNLRALHSLPFLCRLDCIDSFGSFWSTYNRFWNKLSAQYVQFNFWCNILWVWISDSNIHYNQMLDFPFFMSFPWFNILTFWSSVCDWKLQPLNCSNSLRLFCLNLFAIYM